jgi:hypothetical protein
MALTVARGVAARIRKHRRSIVIQVQGASDPDAAVAALSRARVDIAALDGGWSSAPGLSPGDRNGPTYVGGVVPTPAGPFLYIDGGETPEELLATIPDIVIRHLRDAGVTRAVIASPQHTDTPLFEKGPVLNYLPRAVVLHLYPRAGRIGVVPPIPSQWIDEGSAWVAEHFEGDTGAWAQALSVVFPIERRNTREVFEQCRRAGIVQVVAGDLERRIRVLYVAFRGEPPAVAVAAGGPGATDGDLLDEMHGLTQVAQRLLPTLGYAHISVRPTFLAMMIGAWRKVVLPGPLYDELVLDAMPWQLLGPRHLNRLDAAGALPLEASGMAQMRHVSDELVELVIGQPADWLADSPSRERVVDEGRRLLAPCLLTEEARNAMISERRARQQAAGP